MSNPETDPEHFHIRVAGVSHRQQDVTQVQDGDEAQLVPDPENRHDPNAIKVMVGDLWLGFVPARQAETITASMKQGWKISNCFISGKGIPKGGKDYGVVVEFDISPSEA